MTLLFWCLRDKTCKTWIFVSVNGVDSTFYLFIFFFYKATPLNVSLAKYVICIYNSLGFIVLVTQCSGSWPVSCTVHAWLLMLELWNVVGKY